MISLVGGHDSDLAEEVVLQGTVAVDLRVGGGPWRSLQAHPPTHPPPAGGSKRRRRCVDMVGALHGNRGARLSFLLDQVEEWRKTMCCCSNKTKTFLSFKHTNIWMHSCASHLSRLQHYSTPLIKLAQYPCVATAPPDNTFILQFKRN
jgi:hypothetical protein